MAGTIEIVTFNLKDGVERGNFESHNADVEHNLVSKMPGFINRETGFNDDGQVVVVLHWENPESAQGSMDKFQSAPESQDFLALIDTDTFKMVRYQHLDVPAA